MSFLPSPKFLRFPTHHHRHRQTPHHHTQPSTSSYTYTYITDPRSPTSLLHSPEHITVTPHVHDHSYASLPHPPSKQTDAIMKVDNWMKDGSVCSALQARWKRKLQQAHRRSRRTQRPRQFHLHNRQHSLLPHQFILPPMNTYTPPASSCQAQTIIIDNITTKHTRAEIEIKLRRQFPGVRYALTFLKRGGLALILETPKEINTILKQPKWDEDFFGKDLYIHQANKDARPWLCVNKVPPTMELAKIKEGLSSIDPVVGMENWEIRIDG